MKIGMTKVGQITSFNQLMDFSILFRMFTNIYIWAGLLCFASMVVIWLAAMSTLSISKLYPLASLVYVVTVIAAIVLLKEQVTVMQWVGILLIVGGCFLVGQKLV
jgi:drug/metabolite transporter (DMT)-like permease